mmetsp:Transcript_2316/g.6049  ORF Transcript_2316/g.6049 Transcript_2316/m.6049 type:complete len:1005 (-) Transcript_2316:9-3023(-)
MADSDRDDDGGDSGEADNGPAHDAQSTPNADADPSQASQRSTSSLPSYFKSTFQKLAKAIAPSSAATDAKAKGLSAGRKRATRRASKSAEAPTEAPTQTKPPSKKGKSKSSPAVPTQRDGNRPSKKTTNPPQTPPPNADIPKGKNGAIGGGGGGAHQRGNGRGAATTPPHGTIIKRVTNTDYTPTKKNSTEAKHKKPSTRRQISSATPKPAAAAAADATSGAKQPSKTVGAKAPVAQTPATATTTTTYPSRPTVPVPVPILPTPIPKTEVPIHSSNQPKAPPQQSIATAEQQQQPSQQQQQQQPSQQQQQQHRQPSQQQLQPLQQQQQHQHQFATGISASDIDALLRQGVPTDQLAKMLMLAQHQMAGSYAAFVNNAYANTSINANAYTNTSINANANAYTNTNSNSNAYTNAGMNFATSLNTANVMSAGAAAAVAMATRPSQESQTTENDTAAAFVPPRPEMVQTKSPPTVSRTPRVATATTSADPVSAPPKKRKRLPTPKAAASAKASNAATKPPSSASPPPLSPPSQSKTTGTPKKKPATKPRQKQKAGPKTTGEEVAVKTSTSGNKVSAAAASTSTSTSTTANTTKAPVTATTRTTKEPAPKRKNPYKKKGRQVDPALEDALMTSNPVRSSVGGEVVLQDICNRFCELSAEVIKTTQSSLVSLELCMRVLQVSKRRLYDIVHVLEGIGILKQCHIPSYVDWGHVNPRDRINLPPDLSPEEARRRRISATMNAKREEKLSKGVDSLKEEEEMLDEWIRDLQAIRKEQLEPSEADGRKSHAQNSLLFVRPDDMVDAACNNDDDDGLMMVDDECQSPDAARECYEKKRAIHARMNPKKLQTLVAVHAPLGCTLQIPQSPIPPVVSPNSNSAAGLSMSKSRSIRIRSNPDDDDDAATTTFERDLSSPIVPADRSSSSPSIQPFFVHTEQDAQSGRIVPSGTMKRLSAPGSPRRSVRSQRLYNVYHQASPVPIHHNVESNVVAYCYDQESAPVMSEGEGASSFFD